MADLARALQSQNIWFARQQYVDAEIKLARHNLGLGDASPKAEKKAAAAPAPKKAAEKPASKAVEMVRELKQELSSDNSDSQISAMMERVLKLEKENEAIRGSLEKAFARLEILEKQPAAAVEAAPAAAPAKEPEAEEESDDDDDFFASSDDDEEAVAAAEALKAKRVAEYNARKAAKEEKKGKVIAKSSIMFDVKPWDDETDLDALCAKIKAIEKDGLVWGAAQKKPLAYGIFKLCVTCVVEDDKVGSDELIEEIEGFEDEVQSVDVAAFNKI